jgi:predicted RNA-binding Zn-ribbon protein involved in translation (DUF1610 family)
MNNKTRKRLNSPESKNGSANKKPTDMKQASMPRENYDWSDPRCPQCGAESFIVRCSEVRPLRKFTKRTLAQAIAAGLLVEGGRYYSRDKIHCFACNTATKLTDPPGTFVSHKK